MGTKMEPSYANFFHRFYQTPIFQSINGSKPELYGRYTEDCIGATSSTREELAQFITTVNSVHPVLKYSWEISDSPLTSLDFLNIKISTEGNGLCASVYHKPTDSIVVATSSRPSHVKNSILFSQFLRHFVVYVATTLIFPTNRRQYASCSTNVAILFLSYKRATTAPNKLMKRAFFIHNIGR